MREGAQYNGTTWVILFASNFWESGIVDPIVAIPAKCVRRLLNPELDNYCALDRNHSD